MNTHFNYLIFLGLILYSTTAFPQIQFEHLTLQEGLSQSTVYAIWQDSKGFMWFGTQDGLNKYDGYQFTVYRHHPEEPYSLSHNEVFAIYEDSQQNLWIGTGSGLNRFDRQQERFTRYLHDSNDPHSLSHNEVWSIYEDKAGFLWLGTHGGGLNRFDQQRKQFERYQADANNPQSLSHNQVWPIYQDRQGTLWIGTYGGGLNKFNPQTQTFKHYLFHPQNPDHGDDFISSLAEDEQGKLWIGTAGGGIYHFDPLTEQFTHYASDAKNPYSLSDNIVSAIKFDENGILWIATDGGGINQFDPRTQQFTRYQHDPNHANSLNSDATLSLYQDHAGTWWIGTGGGGLNTFNPHQKKFAHYFHIPNNPHSLNNNHLFALYEDKQGFLWVGTKGGGVNRFDPTRQRVVHYLVDADNFNSLSNNDVRAIYEDSQGILWFGTYGGGLNRFHRQHHEFIAYNHDANQPTSITSDYILAITADNTDTLWIGTQDSLEKFDRDKQQFIHYIHQPTDPTSLSHSTVLCLHQDQHNTLWIGTLKGLNRFNRENNNFTRYQHVPTVATSLSHDEVSSIYEDKSGTLWVGTSGGGLNKFNRETETFTHYREEDGLANDVIYGILEDEQNNLWISTNKGLSKFNRKKKTFKNYDVSDGLQSLEFNGAYFKSQRGELFFGGINGFNAFFPEQVKDNPYIPPITLTGFEIFNQPVLPGKNSPLQQIINETREITLSYQQTFFSFEFAALNFLQPLKNQYAYRLENFDKNWNYVGNRRQAYYTNVPHGSYIFHLKGSNNDNIWNEQGISLKITIPPPPWQTWWAYTIYFLTILAILTRYWWQQRQQLLEKQRELERERQIAAQLKEADRLKDEFLANTSHELRTPLNGIIGIGESLIDGATGQLSTTTNANLAMIVTSARRLLNLVNDILDFAKLKQKEIGLQLKAIDIRTIAELVLTLTRPLIGSKPLQLLNAIAPNLPLLAADENRVQQILYNLIGNAIKFTEQGTITLTAQIVTPANDKQWLAITVADTGIGIPTDKLDRIFEAFEQADGSTSRIYGGTGLGLAVTQQLVRLHGGQVTVQSEVGVGSQFTFTLPIADTNTLLPTTAPTVLLKTIAKTITPPEQPQISPAIQNNSNTYKILIVDDEPVNRQVLINHLSLQNYTVIQATSGIEALQLINEPNCKPDLILLDIMMPHLTGYEVTQTIRKTWQVNELPILLLTAKNQIADLITGFEVGANDYLTKPVSKEELLARIKTHLHIQQLRAENLRMSTELAITRRLQQMLLPTSEELKTISNLDIAGTMLPAEEVGGDYYDVLEHNGRILFGIGDATGHGLESGVMMLMAQTAVRTLLEHEETDSRKFLNTLNRTLYKNIQQRMKVDKNLTLSLLEYQADVDAKGILKVTGQHEEIIIIRKNGELQRVSTESLGFMVGFIEDIADFITQLQLPLNTGDTVVLYTDGITEAQNAQGEYYGLDRLCEVIERHHELSAQEIQQAIIADVKHHLQHHRADDDMSLLIIKQK